MHCFCFSLSLLVFLRFLFIWVKSATVNRGSVRERESWFGSLLWELYGLISLTPGLSTTVCVCARACTSVLVCVCFGRCEHLFGYNRTTVFPCLSTLKTKFCYKSHYLITVCYSGITMCNIIQFHHTLYNTGKDKQLLFLYLVSQNHGKCSLQKKAHD